MSVFPPVSVITPVYNGEGFLAQTIEAVLEQSFTDFEYILVDDGSTDSSGAILQQYAVRDSRIRVITQANRGGAAARNAGLEAAFAPFAAMLDQDDICLPHRLARQKEYLDSHPGVVAVGGFLAVIDEKGLDSAMGYPLPHGAENVTNGLEQGCVIANPSVMLRREAVLGAGGYNSFFSMVDDYDLWLRLKEAGFLLDNIPEILLRYRLHGANHSTRRADELAWERGAVQAAHLARVSGTTDPVRGLEPPFSLAACEAAFARAGAGHILRRCMLRAHMESCARFSPEASGLSRKLLSACLLDYPRHGLPPFAVLGRLILRNVRAGNLKAALLVGSDIAAALIKPASAAAGKDV